MPISAINVVEALRAEQRRLRGRSPILRMWRALCGECQRLLDRAAASGALRHRAPWA